VARRAFHCAPLIKRGDNNVIQILENYHKYTGRLFFNSKFFHDVHKRVGLRGKGKHHASERLAVQDGAYIIAPIDLSLNRCLIDILAQFLSERGHLIDCVVELGSGIGRNLFALAHKLDPQLKKRITFYACEFTTSGKEVCAALQELCIDLSMSIQHFDYYRPDFSFLPPKGNVLFFTCHSIEQIPILNRAVFDEIIAASDCCFCYHAEPVGWQYVDDLMRQRAQTEGKDWKKDGFFLRRKLYKADRFMFSRVGIGFMDTSKRFGIDVDKTDIGKSDRVSANAAKWSAAKDYNTNLVTLLMEMEREGLIDIDIEKINLFGENPFNPTTVIAWHKT
jgi:SAM-dependent methyltransferase